MPPDVSAIYEQRRLKLDPSPGNSFFTETAPSATGGIEDYLRRELRLHEGQRITAKTFIGHYRVEWPATFFLYALAIGIVDGWFPW